MWSDSWEILKTSGLIGYEMISPQWHVNGNAISKPDGKLNDLLNWMFFMVEACIFPHAGTI